VPPAGGLRWHCLAAFDVDELQCDGSSLSSKMPLSRSKSEARQSVGLTQDRFCACDAFQERVTVTIELDYRVFVQCCVQCLRCRCSRNRSTTSCHMIRLQKSLVVNQTLTLTVP
jgi:hypothetical protein